MNIATASWRRRFEGYLLLGSAVLIIVGSFLPWAKATVVLLGTFTESGFQGGDGWVAIGIAAPLAYLGMRAVGAPQPLRVGVLALVLAAALSAFVVYETAEVSNKLSKVNDVALGLAHATVGIGLWVMYAAAAFALIGSTGTIVKRQRD
ncbi:MAG: hypothetical protein M3Q30_15435 [Actinomycetota bacterium]|nr:hypothetical protein [Actinomycetota bacterium]